VIHAAAHVRMGWCDPRLFHAVNVIGTRNDATASRDLGARMVHISSTDVFGRCSLRQPTNEETVPQSMPNIPYAMTKRAGEGLVLEMCELGLNGVIANPGFMLGPWDWKPSSGKVMLAVGRGTAIVAPKGWFSLCDARDVAAGVLAARDCEAIGRRYILAGETLRFIDGLGGYSGDIWGWLTGKEPDVNSAAVAMARIPKNYSSARAECELGYHRGPLHETISDAWHWFRAHGYR
jgi:dihydroflavonol-4-reductase